MKRSGFTKRTIRNGTWSVSMPKTLLKPPQKALRRSILSALGKSPESVLKRAIQALLREIVILRDGGCILRFYDVAGACGGYANDGHLILQGEHLITRGNSRLYGDTRNLICLCERHHIFFKPQNSDLYWRLVEDYIGKPRMAWLRMMEAIRGPFRADYKLIKIALTQELAKLQEKQLHGN